MKLLHFHAGCFVLLASFFEIVQPTCVLESDFGFKINCAFKKAGLFRVRNLGGLKAHASIGFSLGDELGFEQSLTNLDPSRRRSVSLKNGAPPNLIGGESTARTAVKQEKRGKQNRIMMRPPAPSNRLNPLAAEKLSTLHRRVSSTMQPIVVSGPSIDIPTPMTKVNPAPKVTMAKPLPMGVPPFKPLPPKDENLKVLPISSTTKKTYSPLQVPQSKGPSLAYQSENYQNYPRISQELVSKMISQMQSQQQLSRITQSPIVVENTPKAPNAIFRFPTTVNPFVPMPIAAPPTQAAISIIPAPVLKNSVQIPLAPNMLSKTPTAYSLTQNTISIHRRPEPSFSSNFVDPVPHQVHDLANQLYPAYNTKKADDYNSITGYGDDTALKFTKEDINEKIAEIARAGNISMEAVEAAIALRQQQLLNKYANIQVPSSTTTTTTTTTTTQAPLIFEREPEPEIIVQHVPQKPKRQPTTGKVMNAPREYYPVGYEKNFDDQFQSKVDLPETSFHCGDQKYFPGLYGDENLGCMVFHVCALTDDGLVMKSFLCPESTLFDQTILKCNWWFYVDCKNTRKLYDTNIPVSKSYQLMKALTFFSAYKKDIDDPSRNANPEDIAGIKEAITILENQDNMKAQSQNQPISSDDIQIITPQPISNSDSNIYRISTSTAPSPVYRSNRNYRNTTQTNNSENTKKSNSHEDLESANSEFRLVTVNAGLNFNGESAEKITKNTSSESSTSQERQYRRRHTSRSNKSTTTLKPKVVSTTSSTTRTPEPTTPKPITPKPTTPKPTTPKPTTPKPTTPKPTTPKPTTTTPSVEIIKQEIQEYIETQPLEQVKAEKLSDQIDLGPTVLKEAEYFTPVKRFYRSSAEHNSKEIKEMALINNEKVQIIRPTSQARLVGEFQTPTATIAKLDEAILGRPFSGRFKKDTSRFSIVTPELSPPNRVKT